jgi:hypothetical protein
MWSAVFKVLALGAAVFAIYLFVKNWDWISDSVRKALAEHNLNKDQLTRLWLTFETVVDAALQGTGQVRVRLLGQLALPPPTQEQADALAETVLTLDDRFTSIDEIPDAEVQAMLRERMVAEKDLTQVMAFMN